MKKRAVIVIGLMLCAGLVVSAVKNKPLSQWRQNNLAPTPSPIIPPVCQFSKIVVNPGTVNDPATLIASGKEIKLQAVAYDNAGKPVPANLIWYFRAFPNDTTQRPDLIAQDTSWYFRPAPNADRLTVQGGHRLASAGDSATVTVSGMAAGTFRIAAEAQDCVGADGYPLRGAAEIKVYANPSEVAKCGPILIMNGQEDVTDLKVLGFINFSLKAVIYGPKNLKGYKVQFHLNKKNDQPRASANVQPKRPLLVDKWSKPEMGQDVYYWAYTPTYLLPGEYTASYSLFKGKQEVCASTEAYFITR